MGRHSQLSSGPSVAYLPVGGDGGCDGDERGSDDDEEEDDDDDDDDGNDDDG